MLQRDHESKEMAPQVIQSQIKDSKDTKVTKDVADNLVALEQLEQEAAGHKFGLPELPLPSNRNLKYRYDPVVSQVTNLIMKHGKLSVAQRASDPLLLSHQLRPPITIANDIVLQEHVLHPQPPAHCSPPNP